MFDLTVDELENMLEDLGAKPVTRWETTEGGQTVWTTFGVFEVADESIGAASMIGMETLVIPTGALGDLKEGMILEVEGEGEFLMQFARRERDGALSRLALVSHGNGA